MTIREKNQDKRFNCKSIKTAIKRAIQEGLINVEQDFGDMETLNTYIEKANKTGMGRQRI